MADSHEQGPENESTSSLRWNMEEIDNLKTDIHGLSQKIEDLTFLTQEAQREKAAKIKILREHFSTADLPIEAKLTVVALLRSTNASPNDIANDLDQLKELNERVEAHRGEVVSWISEEKETLIYHDPGPNQTQDVTYLNMGLLPSDATLEVDPLGYIKIPIKSAVKMQINKVQTACKEKADYSWIFSMGRPEAQVHQDKVEIYKSSGTIDEVPIFIGEQEVETLIQSQNHEQIKDMLIQTKDSLTLTIK